MAKVAFKKGLLSNLPAALSAGTFYVTTDERALYLDVDGTTRVRIGDFQEFATLAALQANTNPSTTALYYVTELNCLAKWDGTQYRQINIDTGATAVNVTGEGNALTGVTYDAATRTLTFTKTSLFATVAQVDGKVSASEATLKAYVDEKTEGIASDTAVTALASRVTAAEGKLDVLTGGKTTEGSVAKAIADLQGDTESTVADVDARVCTIEDNYTDHGDVETAINKAIGTNPDKKTVVELINEAKTAATYDDTELSGKVNTLIGTDTGKSARTIANEELVKQLVPENAGESLDTLTEIAAWIQAHPGDAAAMNAAIEKLNAILAGIGGEGEKATVAVYVADAIAALSIGDYAKAADLTALAARVTALEGDTHTHGNKALLDTYTQTEANLADAVSKKHNHSNKTVLDGIDAAKVTAWDGAEQNAKDYTDGMLTWGTF